MLNSGKKKYSNSRVVWKKISDRIKKPEMCKRCEIINVWKTYKPRYTCNCIFFSIFHFIF